MAGNRLSDCSFQGPALVMAACFVASDLAALTFAWAWSVLVRFMFGGQFELSLYWSLAPCLGLFLASNALLGLYSGVLFSPPEELKKLSQSTSVIFLALAGIIFLSRQGELYSRGIFLMAWIGALIWPPLFRAFVRRVAHGRSWWGLPVIILGAGQTGEAVGKVLTEDHRLGLRPVAFFDDDPALSQRSLQGIPVLGPLSHARSMAKLYPGAVAIVAMPGVGPGRLVEILEGAASEFRRQIIIPDLFGAASLWISAYDIGGIIGLEVRQKLLDPQRQFIKRCMELGLIFLFLPLLVVISVAIAVWVKLDSRGPVFYRHKRIGQHGQDILIWKFRTMVQNADDALEQCLEGDPELRAEWERNQKLCRDPRITRAGRFLRRTSLDELPQLWNVLWGDLSLVGPRPIVWSEVERYEGGFALYQKVKPGLTGLWQISGRSDTTYAERVRLDAYYVRNWSVWFDIYILSKTPLVVLRGRGAC